MTKPTTMTIEEWRARTAKPAKAAKYRNRKVEIDGFRFDSVHEGRAYSTLKLREKAGEIRDLKLQPVYPLIVQGVKVCDYVGDFEYQEKAPDRSNWTVKPARDPFEVWEAPSCTGPEPRWITVTEDAKGVRTKDYRIKAKLFAILYGRTIRET